MKHVKVEARKDLATTGIAPDGPSSHGLATTQ